MGKSEKRLFFGVLLVLLGALALLLGRWALGDTAAKVYHVSVLLDGAESDYWKNFRAGLNQAALEQNVDLRFVARYDGETTQAVALRREWEGQADGVVVIPTDDRALTAALEEAPAKLAVAVLGPRPAADSRANNSYLAPDYDQMGGRLAQAAVDAGDAVTLFVSPDPSAAALLLAAGVEAELALRGVACARVTIAPGDLVVAAAGGALVAVEPAMTEALAQLPDVAGRVCGVGASGRLIHYLEEGDVAALAVQSDYDAGYLALKSVVERITSVPTADVVLESYTATRENMREEPMINILFANY